MRIVVCVGLVACLLLGRAAARDVFVDNVAGDDRNLGSQPKALGDRTSPVRTIAKALRLAVAGDHVVLADHGQPYREAVAIAGRHNSGIPNFPFVLEGNGATLDGTMAIPAEGWRHYRDNIFRFRPTKLSYAVLFFDGRSISPLPLASTDEFPPRLEPLQWCTLGGDIFFAVQPNRLPADYKLSYAVLGTGLTLYHVDHVHIRNLNIKGYQVDGLAAADAARNVVLSNVTLTANGRGGISVRTGAQVEISGCKLSGNGRAQLLTLAESETHLDKSDLSGDTAPAWVDQGGRTWLDGKRAEGGKKEIKQPKAGNSPQ